MTDVSCKIKINMKILVVEDDPFVNSMLKQILESAGFSVNTALNASGALDSISESEPNLVITDLDLGDGPNGADLINIISRKFPWINILVLTTHQNPALAIYPSQILPEGVAYLTKGDLADKKNLVAVVKEAMTSKAPRSQRPSDSPVLNSQQAEVLLLISKGLSNQSISDIRGVSLRSVEISVAKIYDILEIEDDSSVNKRLKAAEIWRSGRVLSS